MAKKHNPPVFPQFDAFSVRHRLAGSKFFSPGKNGERQERSSLVASPKVVALIFVFACVVFGGFAFRLVHLQILSHQKFLARARENSSRTFVTAPQREIILDRNNKVIAYNRPVFELYVDRAMAPAGGSFQEWLDAFHLEGGVRQAEVFSPDQAQGEARVLVASDDQYVIGLQYLQLIQEHKEFSLKVESRRVYPYSDSLSHVVGYVGQASSDEWTKIQEQDQYATVNETVGKAGIEKQFDELLKGDRSVTTVETNAFGDAVRLVSEQRSNEREQLRLSIDAEMQDVLYQSLKQSVAANGGSGGAVLASDVKTGEVLVMTSFPSFDNNTFNEREASRIESILNDKRMPLFFRAISGEYPSGSIIKPVFALGALQQGVITPQTAVRSTGGIRVGDFFFPDWKEGGHGVVDVYRAIAESVNTFFYYIGGGYGEFRGLGIERLGEYARIFGLGSATGIDLNSEQDGFIPSPEWKEKAKNDRWYIGDTYHFSIGQGDLLVTPIQMLQMIATIANQGRLVKPHMVFSREASEVSVPIDPNHFLVMKRALRETVLSGSAQSLSDLPVSVAGKTGTAEVGNQKRPHAWFIGFAPYEDPRFAFVVLVENGGEGSTAAVPVARRVVEELNKRYLSKPGR